MSEMLAGSQPAIQEEPSMGQEANIEDDILAVFNEVENGDQEDYSGEASKDEVESIAEGIFDDITSDENEAETDEDDANEKRDGGEDAGESDSESDDTPVDQYTGGGKKNAQTRIEQLARERKEERERADKLEQELNDIKMRNLVSNDKYPDPAAAEQELIEKRTNLMSLTASQLVQDGVEDPETGEPYTIESARSALAIAQNQVNAQLDEVRAVREEATQRQIQSNEFTNQMVAPLNDLIAEYPQLDDTTEEYNPNLSAALKDIIAANTYRDGAGLIVGFKQEPDQFIGTFRKALKSMSVMKASAKKKADSNVDKLPNGGAKDKNRTEGKVHGAEKDIDEFVDMVNEAMNDMAGGL